MRRRRAVCIIAAAFSRLFLLVMAAAAVAPSGEVAVALLVIGLFLHASFGAIAGCSWNSWMRDFVPENRLGTVFGKRLLLAAGLSAVLSFAGGAFVDAWPRLLDLDSGFAYRRPGSPRLDLRRPRHPSHSMPFPSRRWHRRRKRG